MSKTILNLLNCKQHLRNNVDKVIEAFVRFYGEDKRDEIESRFGKVLFMAYRDPESTGRYLQQISKKKSEILKRDLLKDIDTNLSETDLFNSYDFEYTNIMSINKFKEFYEQYKLGSQGRLNRFINNSLDAIQKKIPEFTKDDYLEIFRTRQIPEKYNHLHQWQKNNILYFTNTKGVEEEYERKYNDAKELLNKIDPHITIKNIDLYMDLPEMKNLIEISSKLDNATDEYNSYMEQYEVYKKEEEEFKSLRYKLQNKYYQLLIKENIDLIPEDKRNGIDEFLEDPDKSYLLDNFIRSQFGFGITSDSPLESFSIEADEKLNGDEKEWIKKRIIDDRIDYFRTIGLDVNTKEDLDKESTKAKWPTDEQISKFIKTKHELLNQYNIELYDSLPAQKDIRREIEEKNLLDKNDSLKADLYTNHFKTFMNPNLRLTDKGYELYSIIAIDCSSNYTGDIDHNTIHEMNHLYELSLSSVQDNQYECICGWDTCSGDMNQEDEEIDTLEEHHEIRDYELFNEIINEMITQEICDILHSDGTYIFDSKNNSRTKGTTSYEHTMFLVRDFYNEFKDKIIESRSNGNIEVIWNEVGKANFDELNNLFTEFNEHFSGMKIYGVLSDISNNVQSEEASLYKSLQSKSQMILENMRNYKKIEEIKGATLS